MFSTSVGVDIELVEEDYKEDYTTRTLRITDIKSGISRKISNTRDIFTLPLYPAYEKLFFFKNISVFDQ